MLKQKMKTILPLTALTALLLGALLLSACGASTPSATPTTAVDAIYTAAAQTVVAQQAFNTATPVPSATPAPTNTDLPTLPVVVTSTQSAATSVTNNYCDNSVYLSDVTIPDNTVIAAGQTFVKTWSFQNTGTCAWTADGYTIIFSNGDLMSGNTRPIGTAVAPQGSASISVSLVAPNTAGTYKGYWRLANGKGQPFGQTVSVIIVVGGTTGTVTSTATITPGGPTLTPTKALTSTITLTPTVTLTIPPRGVTSTPTATFTALPTDTSAPATETVTATVAP